MANGLEEGASRRASGLTAEDVSTGGGRREDVVLEGKVRTQLAPWVSCTVGSGSHATSRPSGIGRPGHP